MGRAPTDTARLLAGGSDVVLVIDVQGARQVAGASPGRDGHLRDAAVVSRARTAAARPEQGQRDGDPQAAAGGP
ncbi:MAG: hypothetical protein QM736_25560 [Vicinamibacterales bacterium]